MIKNGRDLPFGLAASALPNMSSALTGLFQPLNFILIQKSLVNGLLQEIETPVNTKGVREPWQPQALLVKPEGQRAWKWETLRCLPEVILVPDDRVNFDGSVYRVMQKYDYKEYGYVQYDIAQDFTAC